MGGGSAEETGEERALRRAKNIAVKLLARRARSGQELQEKLEEKGIEASVARSVRDYFVSYGYIADDTLARDLARRLVERRGWGYARIVSYLRTRGLSDEVVEAALSQMKEEHTEEETARRIMMRRFSHFDFQQASPKEKRRVVQFLARRGFSWDTIGRIVKS